MSKDLPIPPRFEKQDNPEFVELLRVARYRLSWNGYDHKTDYICYAIPKLGTFLELQDMIVSSFGNSAASSYDAWLNNQNIDILSLSLKPIP